MKKIILSFFVLSLGFFACAQEVATITFDSLTIDYGTLVKGADGVRQFRFTNSGTADLEITQVRSSCGCTIPKKPEAPILPGKTGEIQVKYNTALVGPIRKAITVKSNADTPTKILTIKGMVEKTE